jgi:excinuclease UvrABC nuclease subunit
MKVNVQLCCTHAPLVPKVSGVYVIYTRIRGERYIGAAKDLNGRFRDHLWSLMKGNHSNPKLQRLFNKRQILFFRVLVTCVPQYLKRYEQEMLDRNKLNVKLVNRSRVAHNHRSWK